MELNQVQAFLAVAQMRSFSRATAVLHLSQPATSRRIALLESELGVKLFDRVVDGAVLTEAGERLLPHAQRVIAAVRDSAESMVAYRRDAAATVRLAVVGTLASTEFTERLVSFRERHPDVALQLRTARSAEVSDLVRTGDVHLGLRYFVDPGPDVISRRVSEERTVIVCAAHRAHPRGSDLSPDDLRGIPWVGFPSNPGTSGESFALLLSQQLALHGLEGSDRISIDSLTAQKRLIEADFGIGLLPASSVQEELHLGSLRLLSVPELQPSAPIMVVHRDEAFLTDGAKAMLAELIASGAERSP